VNRSRPKLSVIYLHASGTGPAQWLDYMTGALGERQQEAMTLTGYGGVPFDPSQSGLEQDLDRLFELFSEQSSRIHLVGHSYGGLVALLGAMRAEPNPVASLTLMEPVAFGLIDEIDATTGSTLGAETAWARDPTFDTPNPQHIDWWMETFVDHWSGRGAWRRRPPNKQRQLLLWGPKIANAVYHASHTSFGAADLRRLDIPSLVMWGSRTTHVSHDVSQWIAEQLPNRITEVLRGAGHFFPMSDPDRVIPHLAAHFEEVESRLG
jgi:pimeloyl-ACP methyl ester carboxylesterase